MDTTAAISGEVLKTFESVPDLYLILSPDLVILTASDAYLEATLTRRDQIVGKALFEVFPDNPARSQARATRNLKASLEKVLRTGQAHQMVMQPYDVPRPGPAGGGFEEKYWSPYNTPILDEQGNIRYIIHKVVEVTELVKQGGQIQSLEQQVALLSRKALASAQQQTQEALASKNLLLSVFDSAPNSLAVYKILYTSSGEVEDFEILMFNKVSLRIIGLTHEEIIGKRYSQLFPQVVPTGILDRFKKVAATGQLADFEQWYTGEGMHHWFHIIAAKVDDMLLVTSEDITERKNAEQQLLSMKEELAQRATDKYLTLFNHMDQGFCIIEMIFDDAGKPLDYRFLEVNPAFEKQTGLKNSQGKTVREMVPEHEEHWFQIYGKVALSGKSIHFENQALHLAGGIWYDVFAFRFGAAQERQVAVLFQDITDRKRREANLTFLSDLGEALAGPSSAAGIIDTAGRRLGSCLHIARCFVVEVDEASQEALIGQAWQAAGMPDLPARIPISGYEHEVYHQAASIGTPIAVSDAQHHPHPVAMSYAALGIRGFILVPLHATGTGQALLVVSTVQPRNWRADEVDLIGEVAQRVSSRLQRARVEEALRESEENLRAMFQVSSVGKAQADAQTRRFLRVNAALCTITGYSESELLHMTVDELNYPEDRAEDSGLFSKVKQNLTDYQTEKRYLRKDGSVVWVYVTGNLIRDASGKPLRTVAVIQDITDRKKAEQQLKDFNMLLEKQVAERTQALQASKDRFEASIHVSPLVLSILKSVRNPRKEITDFRFDWISKIGQVLMGKDVTGLSLRAQFPFFWDTGLFQLFVHTVETGQPADAEFLLPADGIDRWVHWKAVRFEDGLFVSVEDVTERKKAEEEVTKHLALLRQSEEVAKSGSWEYDLASGLCTWSAGMYRLFGLPEGSPVSLDTFLDEVLEEDRPIAAKITEQLQTKQEQLAETLRIRAKGQVLTFRIRAVVLHNEQGVAMKMLGVALDISEVKRLEEENLHMRLHQQQALLLAILEAQEEERRRISESLHNGLGQLLYATKLNLDQVARTVQNETLQTTEKLLHDAIKETRRVSHELVPVILKDFGLKEAILDLCCKYNGSSLHLNCQVEGLGGRLKSHLEIALYRISQELVNNIAKHAGATEALLQLRQKNDRILLQVQDNGQGMQNEAQKRKGIGLSTIRDRVKLLNGTFSITTPRSGKGTRITIRIPVAAGNLI